MPGTSEDARAVAVERNADAVVWVSADVQGYALWVYDVETDQVTARQLSSAPPSDAVTAAAVALSIKTLLRHSAVAPAEERYGSGARHPTPTGATTHPEPPTEPVGSRYDFEGRGGMRLLRTDPSENELRLGLGFLFWPGSDLVGLAVRFTSGPGVSVDDVRFRGRLIDTEVFLGGALRWTVVDVVRLSATGGASAHVTMLDGTLLANGHAADVVRVDPSLDIDLGADLLFGSRFRLGIRGGVSWLLVTQRYLVHGNEVLSLTTAAFEVGLVLGAMLPN